MVFNKSLAAKRDRRMAYFTLENIFERNWTTCEEINVWRSPAMNHQQRKFDPRIIQFKALEHSNALAQHIVVSSWCCAANESSIWWYLNRNLSSRTRKFKLFDVVTFGPCAAQQSDVIFCQNPERTRVPCQPKTASGGGRSGIIRLKHIKVFSICVHPLMVPTSDTHTNGATSWTRIMNGGNVFVCASMKGSKSDTMPVEASERESESQIKNQNCVLVTHFRDVFPEFPPDVLSMTF